MITNNQIKLVKSLHNRKFRQKYNKFIAEGDKIAQEILQNSIYKVESVFATDDWINNNTSLLSPYQAILVGITKNEMVKISALKTSSPVLIVLKTESESINYSLMNDGHALYLDDVQDPGNVGTIIRIADWFGIKSVIRSSGSADFYSPKVVQSTMGSFLNVGLYTEDFDEIDLQNHTTVGAVMHGNKLDAFEWPEKTLLVMGNEGKGISGAIQQQLDHHITIPGSEHRIADSLNVGMATGIIAASMYKG